MSCVISLSYMYIQLLCCWLQEQVTDMCCKFKAKGANDVVKLVFLISKASYDKLYRYLHKPESWVCWPEQRDFTLMAAIS